MADAYDDLTVEELRNELDLRDLRLGGSRDDLVRRLRTDDRKWERQVRAGHEAEDRARYGGDGDKPKPRNKSGRRPTSGRSSSRNPRRPAKRRRRAPAPVRSAARQLAAPVRRQVTSGAYALGLTLAVIALYTLLENAGAVSGLLGAVTRGFQWFASPDRSIPYAPRSS